MTISIDNSKCQQCGICAKICPESCIGFTEGTNAFLNGKNAMFCMSCGQCEAICPSGAVQVQTEHIYSRDLDYNTPEITSEQLKKFLLSRRSIRRYRKESVETEVIEEIIDTTEYAPSAGNLHPINWIIISDPERIAHIAKTTFLTRYEAAQENPNLWFAPYVEWAKPAFERGEDPVCRHAPHLAVATVPSQNPFGLTDSVIALAHFEIAAHAHGIGTCWAGVVQVAAEESEPLRELLGVPHGYRCGYVMMFGYPEFPFSHIPRRKSATITWVN